MANRIPPSVWQSYLGGRLRSLPVLVAEFDIERRSRDARDTGPERVLGVDVSDGVRMLSAPSFCSSEAIFRHDQALDWSGVPSLVCSTAGRFLLSQRKLGIPLVVLSIDGLLGRVAFGHLRYGSMLFPSEAFALRSRLLSRLDPSLSVSTEVEVVLTSPGWSVSLTPTELSRM